MKILEKINVLKMKKKAKYIVGLVASAALISLAIFPSLSMKADEVARFNFMQNDIELLQGLNKSQNETNWKDPVNAVAGDKIALRVYFHNGNADSSDGVDRTAINTIIKAQIPASTTNKVANLSASIDADNAAMVTETIVNGVVVGTGTGLNVSFDQDATLAYIPSSTQIWRENPVQDGVALPDGIASANGVNIGDVKSCWQYAGYVTFSVQSTPKATPAHLTLTKQVGKVTAIETDFKSSVDAGQSEKVEFKIDVKNTGGSDSVATLSKDLLPTDLQPILGSGKIVRGGNATAIDLNDFLADGINIAALEPNELVSIYFQAITPSAIPTAKTVVNNTYLTGTGVNLDASASVNLIAGQPNIERSKSAFNETQNIDATTKAANAGDVIKYTLLTKNTGNLATSVEVTDDISDVLEYANVDSISDQGQLVSGSINYASTAIAPNQEITNWFKVIVKSPLPTNAQNGFSFDKIMSNIYNNRVNITVNVPELLPVLNIQKLVRNVTSNEATYAEANTAYAGDTLEYKIVIKNSGNAPADYIKIYDVLPANVTLDTGVPAIVSIDGQERSIAENIVSGYTITTLEAGSEAYVRFRAIISSGIAANEKLVNTGYLAFAGKTASDIAETVILAKTVKVSVVNPVISLPRSGASTELAALFVALVAVAGTALIVKKVRA